jgi:hypothetical protein
VSGESVVFLRRGDASAEVESILQAVRDRGEQPEAAGFVRYFFVTQAEQTVVMVTGPDVPFAAELRSRRGWTVPAEELAKQQAQGGRRR